MEKGILIEPLPMTVTLLLLFSLFVSDWTSWIVLCSSGMIATMTLALRRYWRISALSNRLSAKYASVQAWHDSMSFSIDDDHLIPRDTLSNQETNSKRVRVLSYNLYLRPPLINSNGNDWKDERLDEFINSVLPNYDIIALQEVFALASSRQRRLIHAAHHLGYHFIVKSKAPPFLTSLKFIDAGLLILSRYPIIEASGHIYKSGFQIDHYAAKQVIWARVQLSDSVHLNVFNTHTQASYFENTSDANAQNDAARLTQIVELCQFVKQKCHQNPSNSNNPIIILGDLNLNARSSTLDGMNKSIEYNWLEDLFSRHFGSRPSDVFNGKIPNDPNSTIVHDLILEQYRGDHPVTYGDARELNGKLIHVQEPVLTNSADWGCRLAIDYIFLLTPSSTLPKVNVVPKSTKIQKFEVEMAKFPFFQLSDHYAVDTTLQILT